MDSIEYDSAVFSETASDILHYFHLLRKHCRSVWEFDNKLLNDGYTGRCLADI
jgi:hypothetical protein